MDKCLAETSMLDYSAGSIQDLIQTRGWRELDGFHRIGEIYSYRHLGRHLQRSACRKVANDGSVWPSPTRRSLPVNTKKNT